MSFRQRLLLFFTIIVVIPMVAVMLVLFSLTADSETGKADAEIAQGLRTSFYLYDDARDDARRLRDRIAGDAALAAALEDGDRRAIAKRLKQLRARHPGAIAIAVYGPDRAPLGRTGSDHAVAFAVASPSTEKGERLGYVGVSTTDAPDFARDVKNVTTLEARLIAGERVLASTVGERGPAKPESGEVEIAGRDYRGRFETVRDPAGQEVRLGLFVEDSELSGAIRDQRLLIAGILLAFLALALVSSIFVVRALNAQIEQFLDAARRLARGDFSSPVPVEGSDEFAELGREFNAMSAQLEGKIEEVERKRSELEGTIRRVGDAFATGLDREAMVNLVVRTAVEACEAEVGRALPIDARRMHTAQVGETAPQLEAALEAAERRAFAVGANGETDWLATLEGADDPHQHQRPVRAEVNGVHALAAQLVARLGRGGAQEQVGVVSIARHGKGFDDTEYELFSYLTGQAAVSIENVDLHEIVQMQAVTDELTGLFNLRHFHHTLDGEIERSRRFGTEVGLAMLDIDDFKRINDTFGHQQGDLVLLEVGRVLRSLSRDIDEPARYGGEEMAVILPQTDLNGAEVQAERMRSAIEELRINRLDGDGVLRVTASFGVASLPTCASDKDGLIAEADAALYRAKRAGKNRVARGEPVTAEG
ncbi:MAG TPA: diguanylate cyclase [Thermoleophilaceae bacterium]|nr:diguanylate cyclase [Thermoleophilaceae bacterium]